MLRPGRLALHLLVLAVLVHAGCSTPREGVPGPEGSFLLGDRAAISQALQGVEQLHGTPLARAAAAVRGGLADCDRIEAYCAPEVEECRLTERWSCAGGDSRLTELWDADFGEWEWMLGRELEDEGRLLVKGRREAGVGLSGQVDLVLPGAGETAWSLLLPAAEPPGPDRLSTERALIHLRLRPENGLDLGRFVRAEGAAAKLYGLRNELFLATTLEGVWEAALYPPAGDPPFPGLALALDVHDRERGRTAVDGFLRELGESWPVRRVPHAQGPWRGECLANLKVMPDLEPCYVVTDDALVVGWNARSLGLALRTTERTAEASGGTVYLLRFPEIDVEIERLAGVEEPSPLRYPWTRIEWVGSAERGIHRFGFRLVDSEDGR